MDEIERATYAERQLVATHVAAGATDIEMPTLTGARASFDEALNAEPAKETTQTKQLRALGLVA